MKESMLKSLWLFIINDYSSNLYTKLTRNTNKKASEISLNVALINLPAAVLSEKSKVQKSVYNT